MAIDTAAIEQAFFDNADYHEQNNVVKARAFQTACRRFIAFIPSATMKGPNSVSIAISDVKRELDEVRTWLKAWDDTQRRNRRYTRANFNDFRG